MKRTVSAKLSFVLAAIIAAVLCLGGNLFAYANGDGLSEATAYQIANKADLLALTTDTVNYDKCFILTADIDLDPTLPDGQIFTTAIIAPDTNSTIEFQGTAFTGVFDGGGHVIRHLTIAGGSNVFIGLFGYIENSGQVKNLGVVNADIQGRSTIGGLVGYIGSGTITSCYATGTVSGTGSDVGGLVGRNSSGTITSCYATGTVSGTGSFSFYTGGLVGYNSSGTITSCYTTGSVSGNRYVGGLVGSNHSGSIGFSRSACTVQGSNEVGGLVGDNAYGPISFCYATGSVSGSTKVGGLAGANGNTITNCYATGSARGNSYYNYTGGLVGYNTSKIISSYSTGPVSSGDPSVYYVGGLAGYYAELSSTVVSSFWDKDTSGQSGSAGGTGKNTSEMKTLSTFTNAGWDFSGTDGDDPDWYMEGANYPQLNWQLGTIMVPDVAGMTQSAAQSAIAAANLVTGQITETYDTNIPAGNVISQSPAAGQKAYYYSAVNLSVSLGRGITVPDVTHMSNDNAQSTLNNCELTVGTIQTAYDRSVPEHNVLTQSPAAGQIVPVGTAVSLMIAGGEGREDDPYRIWTPQQLNSIGEHSEDWGAYFKLMADIDMSAYTGTQYNIIGNEPVTFCGVFDGNGHTISHLTFITDTAVDCVGLFGFTANATIKNLGLEEVNIYTPGSYAGGLVGRQDSGAIINCHITGLVTAEDYSYSYAGGIVGMMECGGAITDSSSTCQVTASTYYYECYAGGLVGRQDGGTIVRCYTTGSATSSSTLSRAFAGGIAGSVEGGGNIVISYSSCSAGASSQTLESYAGGLTGWINDGVIRNSYSAGNATSTSAAAASVAGGMIGYLEWADVSKCYSIGTATANGSGENFAGGFAGDGSEAYECFWDKDTSALETSAGGDSVIGKTTAEMKTLGTFTDAGWDFTDQTDDDIWRMCADGVSYPKLNWQSIDGDLACPAGVDSDDLNYFFQRWLFTDCNADNNFCRGADMNASGKVDLADFAIFANHWLEGI